MLCFILNASPLPSLWPQVALSPFSEATSSDGKGGQDTRVSLPLFVSHFSQDLFEILSGVYLLWRGFSSMDCSLFRDTPLLMWVYSQSLHRNCLLCYGAPPSLNMVFPLLFLTLFIPSSSTSGIFCPFLKAFSLNWWAQLCPAAGLVRSQLEPTLSSMEEPLTSSWKGQPWSSPTAKTSPQILSSVIN